MTVIPPVQRFELIRINAGDYHHDHIMEPDECGEYVLAADYDNLLALYQATGEAK